MRGRAAVVAVVLSGLVLVAAPAAQGAGLLDFLSMPPSAAPPPPPPPTTASHPLPIATRTTVPLGSALWYACADPAFGGPAALACQVPAVAPATPASLASAYSGAFTANFDRLTPENEFKMQWTEPSQNKFDFSTADKVATFAQSRGKHVRGHTLIYAAASPGWVNKPLLPWSRADLLNAMNNHIYTEIAHFRYGYPGVVDEWDVVNEPFVDSGARDPNIFQTVIGSDWIEAAFRTANAADPNALLFLNEFNADVQGARQQAVLALARDFVARGVPIDGVGLEMHVGAGGSYPTAAALENVMSQYAALKLRVAVTELDVLRPTAEDGGAAQRTAYNAVAEACRVMTNCTGVTVWGVADQYSWRGADMRADLIDKTFAAKPAYADVRCRLNDPKPLLGPWTPKPCGPAPEVAPAATAQTTGPTAGSSVASDPSP